MAIKACLTWRIFALTSCFAGHTSVRTGFVKCWTVGVEDADEGRGEEGEPGALLVALAF